MVISLLAITLLIVLLLSYIFFYDSRFFVKRSTMIHLPCNIISQDLTDLSNWPNWLPWLIYDQDARIDYEYTPTGTSSIQPCCLQWRGTQIGLGFISLIPARSSAHYCHTLVEAEAFFPCELHFNIDLGPQGSHTLVSMQITGRIPFVQRWKTSRYLIRAARDLELSLIRLTAHLAQYSEAENYPFDDPKFEILEQTKLAHFDAVIRPFVVSDQPMSQKMEQGFHDLFFSLGPDNPPAGPSFAIYTKADPAHHYFAGKLGIPIQNLEPCDLHPERIILDGEYLTLRYYGSYQHLALAWHVAYSLMRLQHKRVNRKQPGVEIFEVGPTHTETTKGYITKICLPIK